MQPHQRHQIRLPGAFTLMELVIVMGIIALMIAIAIPKVAGISPRRAAFLQLKSAVEAARAEAIRSNNEVYIAFVDALDTPPSGMTNPDDYRFRYYAVFRRVIDINDPAYDPSERYFHDQRDPDLQLEQVKAWTGLPEGTLLALGQDLPARQPRAGSGTIRTIVDGSDPASPSSALRDFPFPLGGASAGTTRELPFLMFNGEGRVQFPQFYETDFHHLGVIEGFAEGSNPSDRVFTATMPHPTTGADIPVAEVFAVNLYSGRTRTISTNR